ncbi:MAG: peptidase MA family metallohydrolase, partial [Anaerolineales bacterium]
MFALLLGAAPRPALAQSDLQELPVGQFVILYPAAHAAEATLFAGRHGQAINNFYAEFQLLYGHAPPPPVNIRFYSDAEAFAGLNALAPQLGNGVFHAHSGAREVALIAPFPLDLFTSDSILNVIRNELNGLFLSRLSEGGLPPGLELGLNQYVEHPGPQTQTSRDLLDAAQVNGLLLPWNRLLDGPWVYIDREVAYPQSLSVAAFLIDSYGFGKLIEFVRAVPKAGGYRAALAQTYGRPLDRLEQDWLAYLPDYLTTRWQVNALFNYDLAPFQSALDAGAYTQVLRGLDYVIPFLQATGQTEKAAQAQTLYLIAAQGTQAGELTKAARDALLVGEYALALNFADQARAAYDVLGDTSRFEEIE